MKPAPMTVEQIPEHLPGWIRRHLTQYSEDPQTGHLWDASVFGGKGPTPCLILTTIGRRSGRSLPMPLIYGRDGDELILIASKGGAPQHPAWYLNLSVEPNVGVQLIDECFAVVARTVEGSDRQRLWDLMVDIYPPYAEYQSKTERLIPVVALARA